MWLQFQGHVFARPWELRCIIQATSKTRFAAELMGCQAGAGQPRAPRRERRFLTARAQSAQQAAMWAADGTSSLPQPPAAWRSSSTVDSPSPQTRVPPAHGDPTEGPSEPFTCRQCLRAGQRSTARALLPAWGTGTEITGSFYLNQWDCPSNCLSEVVRRRPGQHSWGFLSLNCPGCLHSLVVSLWHQQKPGLETRGCAEYLHKFTYLAFLCHRTSF